MGFRKRASKSGRPGTGVLRGSSPGAEQAGALHPEAAYKFDGKDYPIKGSPLADTVAVKRINERSTESILKKGRKVVFTARTVISVDGKTMNQTRAGKDAQDRSVEDVVVYDKQ